MKQTYDKKQMYSDRYGYRSGLNPSMVRHLRALVAKILSFGKPGAGDIIIDVGSNDGTLLSAYPAGDWQLVGIDPTANHFQSLYPPNAAIIPHFFSADRVKERFGVRRARIITSIAMFYDLDAPQRFVNEVAECLAPDGLWLFEQSYLPTMLDMNAYDTICHEHLEYYGMRQIKFMLDIAGLKIIDVQLNDTNGGSFAVIAARKESPYPEASALVQGLVSQESPLESLDTYGHFRNRVEKHREDLRGFLNRIKVEGKRIAGYGASTKGNVILQYCGLTTDDLPIIGEVNQEKFGCFTPGTNIPIISEDEVRKSKPDYLLVLPWHFRAFIVEKETAYLRGGGRLVFPLPSVEAVG